MCERIPTIGSESRQQFGLPTWNFIPPSYNTEEEDHSNDNKVKNSTDQKSIINTTPSPTSSAQPDRIIKEPSISSSPALPQTRRRRRNTTAATNMLSQSFGSIKSLENKNINIKPKEKSPSKLEENTTIPDYPQPMDPIDYYSYIEVLHERFKALIIDTVSNFESIVKLYPPLQIHKIPREVNPNQSLVLNRNDNAPLKPPSEEKPENDKEKEGKQANIKSKRLASRRARVKA